MPRWTPLAALLLLTSVPGAAADVQITHDVPDDGRTYAGNPTSFGVLLLDDAGVPAFHQDYGFTVTWNDVVLLDVYGDAAHDYDGHNAFWLSFPGPGAYTVHATGAGGNAWFNGTIDAAPATTATVAAGIDDAATGWTLTPTVAGSANGAFVPHSDAWFLATRDGVPRLQFPIHQHDEPATVTIRDEDLDVFLQAYQAFPVDADADFLAAPPTSLHRPNAAGVPPFRAGPATALQPANDVAVAQADGLRLALTIDPWNVVDVNQILRLGAVILDADTGDVVPHVDFAVDVAGPGGTVLASPLLHDYDGVHDFLVTSPDIGDHTITVTASSGERAVAATLPFTVQSGVLGLMDLAGLGTHLDAVAPDLWACAPHTFTANLRLGDAAAPHYEVNYWLRDGDNRIVNHGKLHTHGAGVATWQMLVPPGNHTLDLHAYPTSLGGAPGRLQSFDVMGPDCPDAGTAATDDAGQNPGETVPATALAPVAALAVAAFARSRRRQRQT